MKHLQQFLAIIILVASVLADAPASSVHAAAYTQSVATASDPLLQFSSGGHVFGFRAGEFYLTNTSYALHVQFVGANLVSPQSDAPASIEHGASPFQRVTYANLWDGITLTYDPVSVGLARSSYCIEPGADTRAIRLRYNVPVRLNTDGTLTLTFATGQMTESAPIAWQEINGQRIPVPIGFDVFESHFTLPSQEVGFHVGAYTPTHPLFIDPTFTWNTFLGGSNDDYINSIKLDGSGNIYVAGYSRATWQGATPPRRAYSGGSADAFATKLGADGALLWSTFLGGNSTDYGYGIALDGSGNVYVSGLSGATWQGTTPPRRAYGGGSADAFVAKLDASGDLTWNTFLGGSDIDYGNGIAVDGSGNIYVMGSSYATWQGATPPRRAYGGGSADAFAARLDASGDLIWNTFLGGSGTDYGAGAGTDGSGNVYVTGYSDTTWQGATPPRRSYSGGVYDVFAARLDANGDLTWNTFLGGNSADTSDSGIAVDGSGNVYVTGQSHATWQGTTPPRRLLNGTDAFVAKLDANGDLVWNTFLGGGGIDYGDGIALDGSGNVYSSGYSAATWQGATPPLRAYGGGSFDAFAAQLDANGDLVWNTFLGGSGYDTGSAIAVDGSGSKVYATGFGDATWQGTTAPKRSYSGAYDAFVAEISATANNADLSNLVLSSGTLNPAFASATTSYTAGVAYGVASLTVTPTAADAAATITVNGIPVASGSASGGITLNVGVNTITTIVTAADGVTTKTYTVVVTRACGNPITVTNANDSGAGSLRQAIADVCPGGTITFDNDYTIALSTQLAINKSLTIDGVGHTVAVSGNNSVRAFYISSGGTLNLNQLTVTKGNAGSSDGGGIRNYGTLNVTNSTFSGNSTTHYGGGIYNEGTVNVTNSAFSGNSATYGGGIDNLSTVNVTNSTFSGNSATYGGGIDNIAGTVTSKNSIVANTTSGDNCSGIIVGSNNLANDDSCGASFTNSSSILLGSLGSYGGNTETIPLLPGSSAIDAGSDAICAAAPVGNLDQRGVARPQGDNCDIGAFELVDNIAPSLTSFTLQTPATSPTDANTLVFRTTFNEPVKNVDTTDFSVNSTSTATVTAVNQVTNSTYDVTVSGGDLATFNGTVGLNLSAAQDVEDYLGNNLPAGEPPIDQTYTLDNIAPTVTIDQAGTQADPTSSSPINFTVVFSELVTNFVTGDVNLSAGTAPGALIGMVTEIAPLDGTTYNVAVSGMTAGGTVIATINTGVAQDAVFNGNAASTSTDNTVTFMVNTATGLISSTNPAVVGQTVTFTATVTSPGGTPTGIVEFREGATVLGTSMLDAGGQATFSTSALALGTHSITAYYLGDVAAGYNASNSAPPLAQVIGLANTSTAIATSGSPSGFGASVTFTATVTAVLPGSGIPTGNVEFFDGAASLGTSALSVGGQATLTTASLTTGTHTITASYGGDTNYNGSTSPGITQVVDGPPTVTLINSNANTGDGQVVENEYTNVAITQLLVVFNKDMNADTPGDLDDALTVANYSLVQGTATVIPINDVVTYNAATHTAALDVNGGAALPDGEYTLTVLDRIEDTLGVPIGTDFVRHFHVNSGHPHHISIVTAQNNITIVSGTTVNASFSSIEITFDEDLDNPAGNAGPDDVTNPQNYLLLTPGSNGMFDTLSCAAGLAGDDTQIPTGPVTYSNNGGAGPFVSTVQLNNGTALPNGLYQLYICGTTSIVDLAGNPLNGDAGPDSQIPFTVLVTTARNPRTGFAPGVVTVLPEQPADKAYTDLGDLWIEIPKLNLKARITGVPLTADGWDVTWLNRQVGWLEGTAYPTWKGNTVLTAHGYTADGEAGPFALLKSLSYGDTIIIHFNSMKYTYAVRTNLLVSPNDTRLLNKHEEQDWVTLITCQQYDAKTKSYRYRRVVRAVLIQVEEE